MHQWNRAAGDASGVLISLAMAIGPLSRLWRGARRFLPWRREFGVWGIVLAAVHTFIILAGWVEWDLIRLFGFEMIPEIRQYVMVQHGFGLANAIGIAALLYGIVLGTTSNDRSQKFLGGRAWKFLQQGAYVLWFLIIVHTAYFLYLHFLDFHRPVPAPNIIQLPFAAIVMFIAALQFMAFLATWRQKSRTDE
jgi:sulfoxide reductase heme-binding subunit YedZ